MSPLLLPETNIVFSRRKVKDVIPKDIFSPTVHRSGFPCENVRDILHMRGELGRKTEREDGWGPIMRLVHTKIL